MTRLGPPPTRSRSRARQLRFALVASRFNRLVTERLLRGALEALHSAGAREAQIEILRVPGSFEIPLAAKKIAQAGRADAVIAIGCVLRGETSHYQYIATEVARGIQLAQMDTGVPCIFCVLTCDTVEQALARSGDGKSNKGYEAGIAAVEMAHLARKLQSADRTAGAPGPARGQRATPQPRVAHPPAKLRRRPARRRPVARRPR
jgi:6,7-dimethyl-8-ribityllumazine synthase